MRRDVVDRVSDVMFRPYWMIVLAAVYALSINHRPLWVTILIWVALIGATAATCLDDMRRQQRERRERQQAEQ
jgi:hypothetical protein